MRFKTIGVTIFVIICVSSFLSMIQVAYADPILPKDVFISNLKTLCDQHSNVASYESIGHTVEGNDMWLFRIGTNTANKILFQGSIHGMESWTSIALYYHIYWLLSDSPEANYLLSQQQELIIPVVNYDHSTLKTDNGDSIGDVRFRKNMNGSYPAGVDLNRNGNNGWIYNSDPNSQYYSGSNPTSEIETKNLEALYLREQPNIFVDFHDFGGTTSSHGDFRYPNYGGSTYIEECNSLYTIYRELCLQNNLLPMSKMNIPAMGFVRDDAYQNGNCLAALCELTCAPYEMPLTCDYVRDYKTPQINIYALACSQYFANQTPTPPDPEATYLFHDDFENGLTSWNNVYTSPYCSVGTTTNNPHHDTYNFYATISSNSIQSWAGAAVPVQSNPAYLQLYNLKSSSMLTVDDSEDRFVAVGETNNGIAFNGLAYWGYKLVNGNPTWFIRAYSNGVLDDYVSSTNLMVINYDIQVGFKQGINDGYAYLIVDDVCVLNVTGLCNTGRNANYWMIGLLFSDTNENPITMTCDCIYTSSTNTFFE